MKEAFNVSGGLLWRALPLWCRLGWRAERLGASSNTHVETCWDMLHSLLSVVSSMGGSLLSLHWERGDQIEVDEIV